MVALPLALVDVSTCWVIVYQETYALLWHSVEELHLVERNYHYCNVQNYRFGLLDKLKIETWLLNACPSYVLQICRKYNRLASRNWL
jgi:hypothetical protein